MATALALILTIDRTLNDIWRVQRLRPLGQRVLIYWAAITLGPLLMGASLALTSYVMSASGGLVKRLPDGCSCCLIRSSLWCWRAAWRRFTTMCPTRR